MTTTKSTKWIVTGAVGLLALGGFGVAASADSVQQPSTLSASVSTPAASPTASPAAVKATQQLSLIHI